MYKKTNAIMKTKLNSIIYVKPTLKIPQPGLRTKLGIHPTMRNFLIQFTSDTPQTGFKLVICGTLNNSKLRKITG